MAAMYLHLGPFSRYLIAMLDQRIDAADEEARQRTCATITFRAPAGSSVKRASPSTIGGAASAWRTTHQGR